MPPECRPAEHGPEAATGSHPKRRQAVSSPAGPWPAPAPGRRSSTVQAEQSRQRPARQSCWVAGEPATRGPLLEAMDRLLC